MYKHFTNYPSNCALSEALKITMENIKTFLCDTAPLGKFIPTANVNTPIPNFVPTSTRRIRDYTPVIFYSDVVDNNNPAFTIDSTTTFKISEFAYPGYPVYCVFYSWMPCPILIFVTNNFHWSSSRGTICLNIDTSGGGGADDFIKRPQICIAFDVKAFNVDSNGSPATNDYVYGERFYTDIPYGSIAYNKNIETNSYERSTASVCPILVLDPFYNYFGDYHASNYLDTVVKDYSFAMSLYNHTIVFYSINNTSSGTSNVNTTFISPLSHQCVGGCDIKYSDKALICKSDGMMYLGIKYKSRYYEDKPMSDGKIWLNMLGHTIYPSDKHSFMPESVPLAILGINADSNVESEVNNLYHNSYRINWNSYRNCTIFCNPYRKPIRAYGKKYCKEDKDNPFSNWQGTFHLITKWMVPTITTSFQPSFFLTGDNLSLDSFDLPHFPTLTNNLGTPYSHNEALISSMALRDDSEVFTCTFPTQTSNQLNDHFIAYPTNIYIKREPLDTNTHSLLCTLNFMFASQQLYGGDDRFHEYNYLNKKFVGVSNRLSGVLFLVDEYEEVSI